MGKKGMQLLLVDVGGFRRLCDGGLYLPVRRENGDGGLEGGLVMATRGWFKGRGRRLEDEEERGGGRRAVVDEEGDREEVGGMQTFAENMEVMRWFFWPVLMVVSGWTGARGKGY
ncbi:hypothetical protein HAX54_046685 [Datura stramonium]|uniref:Uncharacterized protein n=1 Tax=Datura stramonium TaxID=4076 RepID=A0ABS8SS20_DATST|nr:hypothetical protein [Datura stramonium]